MRQRNDGRIEWRFYVATPTGAKRYSVYGRTVSELKAARRRVEQLYEAAPERITLNEVLDRYLEEKGSDVTADPRKIADMASRFARLVRPQLGRLAISTLCVNWAILGAQFRSLVAEKPNSYVVQRTFDELRRAFKFALSRQWCTINPMAHLERPKYSPTAAREPFTLEQVVEILSRARGRDRVMIAFLVMTALRTWSELSGLRVRDCDFTSGTVSIRTFVRRDTHGRPEEKPAINGHVRGKTYRAAREVPLIGPLCKMLRQHVNDAHLSPDDYLFANQKGGLLRGSNWCRRVWAPLTAAVGRPDGVPYELRHTTNNLLKALGVDAETRAAICGHSARVNEIVYTKTTLQEKRSALTRLEHFFADIDRPRTRR